MVEGSATGEDRRERFSVARERSSERSRIVRVDVAFSAIRVSDTRTRDRIFRIAPRRL